MISHPSSFQDVQLLAKYSPIYEHTPLKRLRRAIWYLSGRWLVSSFLPGSFWRKFILCIFGARIGSNCCLKPRINITSPWHFSVGHHCWFGENVWIDNLALVSIGDAVCISQSAYLCTGNHDYKSTSFDLRLASITIESQSWIGAHAILAPGTHISFGCVVSLGSVVSGSIPQYSIVKGNPARFICSRIP